MRNTSTQGFRSGLLWLAACAVLLMTAGAPAAEWRQYNGPLGNRSSDETIGEIDWSQGPPAPIWKTPITSGFSSFTKSGDKVFTLVRRNDGAVSKEFCVALNAETGAEIWAFPMCRASYDSGGDTNGGGDGPRSTPSCDETRVYAYDSTMMLYCLNASNGSVIWSKNIVSEYGGRNISWGSAASPLLEGEMVIVPGGGLSGRAMLAFNRATGNLVWQSLSDKITHATPVAATIHGVRQIVCYMQGAAVGLSAADGSQLWRSSLAFQTSAAASPVVYGNHVYFSQAYSVGARLYRIDKNGAQWQAVQVWSKSDLRNHWSSAVCHDGYLYGLYGDKAYGTAPLKCIELLTGNEKWSRSGFGQGGLILVNDQLVVLAEDGRVVVVQATPAAYTQIASHDMLAGKCWSTPILTDNRLYARSTTEAICFELSRLASEPPTCSISEPSAAVTAHGPVDYFVTFSEPVTGFDSPDDIEINATGTAAAGSVAIIAGSGAGPYTVRLSDITGEGTLGITIKAAACIGGGGMENAASAPSSVFTVNPAGEPARARFFNLDYK